MAALANPRLERYCQNRAVSGSPGGKSKRFSIWAAISPETSTTEWERFLNLLGDPTAAASVSARLAELGGETSP